MKLGEMLIAENKLSERDLDRALMAQREMGGYLGEVLVRLGLLSEIDLVRVLCQQLSVDYIAKEAFPDEPPSLGSIPEDFFINNRIVPIAVHETSAEFAAVIPQDPFIAKALQLATGRDVVIKLALQADVQAALDRLSSANEDVLPEGYTSTDFSDDEFVEHLRDLASEAPVIQRVNQMIQRALDLGASDVHLESFDDGLHLRYRVDGVLIDAQQKVEPGLGPAIVSRVKLLANLNIAERRLPQDGRIMMRVKGHELDLRVSTLPTVHGEGVVMRVLDRQSIRLELAEMGFSEDTYRRYVELLKRPHGVLLLTGPTGSGKTTSLYASLAKMDATALKIITVEDPVEYQLKGINQIPVNAQIDLTFARALRSILRQDPDIIMVGEMRDTETAQIAVQAALTGHLVLSTLHTNTAAGAITRLEDMGVERFLITAAVNGVLSQRLIRKLCDHCKKPVIPSEELLANTGLGAFMTNGQQPIYEAGGCGHCKGTGYAGRIAIHELFTLDASAQKTVLAGADANELHEHARSAGMRTLYEDGLLKVARGVSSLEEVLRVTQDQSDESEFEAAVA